MRFLPQTFLLLLLTLVIAKAEQKQNSILDGKRDLNQDTPTATLNLMTRSKKIKARQAWPYGPSGSPGSPH